MHAYITDYLKSHRIKCHIPYKKVPNQNPQKISKKITIKQDYCREILWMAQM